MRIGFLCFLFSVLTNCVVCQTNEITKIAGLPTDEVYDVFAGNKGNIWVAHSLGLSRYDGHVFEHFKAPDEAPIAVTDICQDLQGRIWCHDFNGRIFYVENERMKLFAGYKNEDEASFPVTTTLDSQLIITSGRGLFVCNTLTLKGEYLNITAKPIFDKSLAVSGSKVIVYDRDGAFKYEKNKPLKRLAFVPIKGVKYDSNSRGFRLAAIKTKDTIFGFNNYEVLSLIERRDTLFIVKIEKAIGMVNTISNEKGCIWVNTKKCSYTLDRSKFIWNKNLTGIIKDLFGNTWYGSLQEGLLTKQGYLQWQSEKVPFLEKNDFIRCVITKNDESIYGTQTGRILIIKNRKIVSDINLPASSGSIEHLFFSPNNSLIIASSIGLYFINPSNHKLFRITDLGTFKDVTFTENDLLIASGIGIIKLPVRNYIKKLFYFNKPPGGNDVFLLRDSMTTLVHNLIGVIRGRCFQVSYDSLTKTILAIFNNGIAYIIKDSKYFIYKNNQAIQASCIVQHNGVGYVGTLNDGLVIIKNHNLSYISAASGLFSNQIMKMKLFGEKLYLIEKDYLQVLDVKSEKVTTTVPLPKNNNASIYDFYIKSNTVYLMFTNMLYELNISNLPTIIPLSNLLTAKSKESVLSENKNNVLSYNDNNISFLLSSPAFNYPQSTYFIYRLKGASDTEWKRKEGPTYEILYQALRPGNYLFEAYSINFQKARSVKTIRIPFQIKKPWWQANSFYLIFTSLLIIILYIFIRRMRIRIFKQKQQEIDKLLLHDSLRKTLLRTITAQMNPHFIFNAMNTIQSFVYRNEKRNASNYLGKFSELIRKILETSNIDTIALSEEVEILKIYLDLEKARFEDNFNATITINPQLNLSEIEVPPMFIQPYIENAIKHGLFHKKGIKELLISIDIDKEKNNYIRIVIEDNGIGRHRSMQLNSTMKNKPKSFASNANESRIELMNQTLENKIILTIIDKPKDSGTKVIVQLPVLKWNL